jgi:hypothetical protein
MADPSYAMPQIENHRHHRQRYSRHFAPEEREEWAAVGWGFNAVQRELAS